MQYIWLLMFDCLDWCCIIFSNFCFFTETHEQLQAQFREMQLEHYQLKEEYDDLKEKMKFFTKVWKLDYMKLVFIQHEVSEDCKQIVYVPSISPLDWIK